MLQRGVTHSIDPFHRPVLGTAGKDGCSLRTVILRQVLLPDRILVCHTDARAAKVQEILAFTKVSWLFYHPKRKVQLRISGHATLHTEDEFAERQWAEMRVTSRLNYCATRPPGTCIDRPMSGLPDFLFKKLPTLMETQIGRSNFMAIAGRIESIDWLILKPLGNLRARFCWDNNELSSTWLIP